MSDTLGGLLTIALLVGRLALVHVPLGDYLARVFTSTTHLRVERLVYRLTGVNPDAEQGARSYATSVVGFSLAGSPTPASRPWAWRTAAQRGTRTSSRPWRHSMDSSRPGPIESPSS